MIVIDETEPGGEMVCVLEFSARPRNVQNGLSSSDRRTFQVGERVRFRGFYFDGAPVDNPTGYMAIFESLDPHDPNDYAAVADYFITIDCWEGLKQYLKETGDKQPPKKVATVKDVPLSKLSPKQALDKMRRSAPKKAKAVDPVFRKENGQTPVRPATVSPKLKKARRAK